MQYFNNSTENAKEKEHVKTDVKCGGQGHMAPQCPSTGQYEQGQGQGHDFKGIKAEAKGIQKGTAASTDIMIQRV